MLRIKTLSKFISSLRMQVCNFREACLHFALFHRVYSNCNNMLDKVGLHRLRVSYQFQSIELVALLLQSHAGGTPLGDSLLSQRHFATKFAYLKGPSKAGSESKAPTSRSGPPCLFVGCACLSGLRLTHCIN